MRACCLLVSLFVFPLSVVCGEPDSRREWGPVFLFGKGTWAGAEFRSSPKRWFDWEVYAGGAKNLTRDVYLDVGSSLEKVGETETDVFPQVGVGGFFHFPWPIARIFGLGLGVEGFHYHTRYYDEDFSDTRMSGRLQGWGYDLYIPIIRLAVSKKIQRTGGRLLFGFNLTARTLAGPKRQLLAVNEDGDGYRLNDFSTPGGSLAQLKIAYYSPVKRSDK